MARRAVWVAGALVLSLALDRALPSRRAALPTWLVAPTSCCSRRGATVSGGWTVDRRRDRRRRRRGAPSERRRRQADAGARAAGATTSSRPSSPTPACRTGCGCAGAPRATAGRTTRCSCSSSTIGRRRRCREVPHRHDVRLEVNLEDCSGCGLPGGDGRTPAGALACSAPRWCSHPRARSGSGSRPARMASPSIRSSSRRSGTCAPHPARSRTTPRSCRPVASPRVTVVRRPYLQQMTSNRVVVVWATRESGVPKVRVAAGSTRGRSPARAAWFRARAAASASTTTITK